MNNPLIQVTKEQMEQLFPDYSKIPWDNSVESRNYRQTCGYLHPYTCGNNRTDELHTKYQKEHGGDFGQLVAVEDGWVCPACGYKQNL